MNCIMQITKAAKITYHQFVDTIIRQIERLEFRKVLKRGGDKGFNRIFCQAEILHVYES